MSRRHKENDIEKPLDKGDFVNSYEQHLKDGFENTICSHFKPGRMIGELLRMAYDGISSIVRYHLFAGLHLCYKRDCKLITEGYDDSFDLMDIEVKNEYPPYSSESILHKQIDRCLHFGREEDDKPKRGRPIVKQLCEKISDSNVVKVARKCYLNIYRKALKFAQNITQYLVCFLYSLFDIPDNNTETVYGKVGHFHRIMSSVKGLKIPSVRRLQQMLKWFMEWKEAVIKTAKEMKEEITHRAWEELVEKIKRQFEILIPQYAMC